LLDRLGLVRFCVDISKKHYTVAMFHDKD
jgi:hypothetical protein